MSRSPPFSFEFENILPVSDNRLDYGCENRMKHLDELFNPNAHQATYWLWAPFSCFGENQPGSWSQGVFYFIPRVLWWGCSGQQFSKEFIHGTDHLQIIYTSDHLKIIPTL